VIGLFAAGIRPLLGSVLPAERVMWRSSIDESADAGQSIVTPPANRARRRQAGRFQGAATTRFVVAPTWRAVGDAPFAERAHG
jgi:hypothetical protein